MYNGTMSRFDPRPGRAASIAPGKRRASSAAPTIVFSEGKPFVVMGAPGGSYIAPSIAQGIMTIIVFIGVNMIGNPVDILISLDADQAERLRVIH